LGLAFGNCALFVLYVVLGHRVANTDAGTGAMSGVDQLGAAMLVAAVAVTPVGLGGALAAFAHPALLLAGVGVGLCSSVVPYVTDQLAMARLPRARSWEASPWSSRAWPSTRSQGMQDADTTA
jgi:inner membrane transporter RhtA